MPTVFAQLVDAPLATCLILICTGIWFYLWNYDIDVTRFAFNYDRVVKDGQYWRVITATFAHVNILHLVFNMAALFMYGLVLEKDMGHIEFLKANYILMMGSELVIVLVSYAMIRFARNEDTRRTYSLGYSCVVFGLMTIVVVRSRGAVTFFGLTGYAGPFISLAITQFLIPNASFVGHLSGIIVGFLYAFDLFTWMTSYLWACLLFWTTVGFLVTLKKTTEFPLPFLWIEGQDEDVPVRSARIVNGRVVYEDQNAANANANEGADRNGLAIV